MKYKIDNAEIILKIGDITEEDTEAIVNAANSTLMGGGGVDGAIHRKGGPSILEECKRIREKEYPEGLPTGEAVITTGGNLKAKYVIHTVGPVCHGKFTQREKQLLYNAYYNSLKIAKENKIKTVAFPSISTGAYRCPVEEAAKTALKAAIDFIKTENYLQQVRFVLFTEDIYEKYSEALKEIINEI
ncbi:O-acetyl-ADP-ribose deacetylase (regulator of RNase III), contains Macro domain [Persephonella hydrogeniphila]|uniref:O-acetyl-ADP-ribose deacetylase (Regulator of RNase III), contains Macro domain n=1 Tax=Persephonella hydrogeniphila TaxID=198703 RepID=A0A285NIY4_9AQUI|nr:O-acetyl-ADP-ribose deacetylase [Persephonella hydrogeniphila]SNZ09415.1 O-acetyl-ADP-ribose deacetylase (regulator of RNase III), contains Macro domain [Persephonella hydrogeniphila]